MIREFGLSGFSDEASPDIEEQVQATLTAGLSGLDVRSVGGVNVLDLDEKTLFSLASAAKDAGLHIQAVGSPVNKVQWSDSTEGEECAKLQKAIVAAEKLGTKRIRIFTPEAAPEAWPLVKKLMVRMIGMATDAGVLLLHENDGHYFGAYPDNAKRMFEELGGDNFKAAFDFSNATMIGFDPLVDWIPWIQPWTDTLHMKDYSASAKAVVPVGDGDGHIKESLIALIGNGWRGTLTLEPHLQSAGQFGGFSGPELYVAAAIKMIDALGVAIASVKNQ